jgi:hypothetical protein
MALLFMFVAGAIVGHVAIPSIGSHFAEPSVVMAQSHKPILALRLFTGPDGLTHAEHVEMKFTPSGPNAEINKLLPLTGAVEIHRNAAGSEHDWHRAPRKQYIITLSGHAEIEVAGGQKFVVGPGDVDIVEDTTGKGHITNVTGKEDRLFLQLPIADPSGR